jgi:predicted flap endonuclease-1-like 5' DNA nuclease
MTPRDPKKPTAAHAQVSGIIKLYPLEDTDFKSDGDLTDDAIDRVARAALEVLPDETLCQFGEEALTTAIGAYMDELAAIGALETQINEQGVKVYAQLRDWTEEEDDEVSARVKAKTGYDFEH